MATSALVCEVRGIGFWAEGCESWPALRAVLAGKKELSSDATQAAATRMPVRPAASLLPAAERRRIPAGVAVALEVAREATAAAGVDAATLPSVFASAHGDLAIVDYLCKTLAEDANALSPTKFHHSVHNAAAGYWTIATGCTAPATALSAGDESVAAGLFEAVKQVASDACPVLLVVYDTAATGPLAEVAPNTQLLGAAFVLMPPAAYPGADDRALARLTLSLRSGKPASPRAIRHGAALVHSSPSAQVLPLLAALAGDDTRKAQIDYALGPDCVLAIGVELVRDESSA